MPVKIDLNVLIPTTYVAKVEVFCLQQCDIPLCLPKDIIFYILQVCRTFKYVNKFSKKRDNNNNPSCVVYICLPLMSAV